MPTVWLIGALVGLVLLFIYRDEAASAVVMPLAAGLGAGAGIMFGLATRD